MQMTKGPKAFALEPFIRQPARVGVSQKVRRAAAPPPLGET
jgi:hypothetical protein